MALVGSPDFPIEDCRRVSRSTAHVWQVFKYSAWGTLTTELALQMGNTVGSVTLSTIWDLYARLHDQDVDAFLRMLGERSTVEAVQVIVQNLHPDQRARFRKLVIDPMFDAALPLMIREAIQIVRGRPDLTDDEVAALITEQAPQLLDATTQAVTEVERARLKAARDPKPRNTQRDCEIVRLHDQEGRTFGEIPRLLVQKDPSWAGRDGKPLARDTVEKAYHRRKGLGT